MSKLFEKYSDYFAKKCERCKGQKRILIEGVWTSCRCQDRAAIKWRYDQIPIYPRSLKTLTWKDFTGISGAIRLTPESLVAAKKKALKYCFNSDDPKVIENRQDNLVIHQRRYGGPDMVIVGDRQTGKSLLAALILKEIFHVCYLNPRLRLDFQWIKANEIVDAARWDSGREVNRVRLDALAETNFLFIDGLEVNPAAGDHRHPPDMTSVNILFAERLMRGSPTIVTCSREFWKRVSTPGRDEDIRLQWGDEFLALLQNPSNVVIELQREMSR